jgi:hypothetical protein
MTMPRKDARCKEVRTITSSFCHAYSYLIRSPRSVSALNATEPEEERCFLFQPPVKPVIRSNVIPASARPRRPARPADAVHVPRRHRPASSHGGHFGITHSSAAERYLWMSQRRTRRVSIRKGNLMYLIGSLCTCQGTAHDRHDIDLTSAPSQGRLMGPIHTRGYDNPPNCAPKNAADLDDTSYPFQHVATQKTFRTRNHLE